MGKKNMPTPPEILRKGGVHEKSNKAKRKRERDDLKNDLKKEDDHG